MKLRIIIASLCAAVTLSFAGDIPDWVKNQGKSIRFPESLYLTGFGMAKLTKDVDRQSAASIAAGYARANLVQRVRVSIQSTITAATEETEKKLSQYFSSTTQSTSALDIEGLGGQEYFDEDAGTFYSFVFVERGQLAATYSKRIGDTRAHIQQRIASAKKYEESGERSKALEECLQCYPLARVQEESRSILAIVRPLLHDAMLEKNISQDEITSADVRAAVDRLIQKPLTSLVDLSWYIAHCLKIQVQRDTFRVVVAPLTYQDTKMGSSFARFFRQGLEASIVNVAHWEVISPDAAEKEAYLISGTYWEQKDGIKFILSLRSLVTGRTIASVEKTVSAALVESSGLELKPQNFAEAMSAQKQFSQNEIVGGGLNVEVWTQKGKDNVIFTKGEKMQLFVRANMPCYLRLVYHLVSGERTLLLENRYIDESKVNMAVEIPDEFECDAPFGAEFLTVFASTAKFDSLPTVRVGDYDVVKEDLKKFLVSTRGMKKGMKNVLKAEQRIVITNMPG